MTHALTPPRPRAVLVGVHLPGQTEAEFRSSFAELSRLVDTLGFDVVGEVTQKRPRLAPAAGLGTGKLKELARFTGGTGVVPTGAEKKPQKKDLHQPGAAPVELADDEDDAGDGDEDGDEDGDAPLAPADRATVVVVDNELSPSQARNLEKACGVEVLDRAGVIIEIFWRHARTKEAQMQVEIARLQYEAPRLREKEHSGDRQRGGGVGGKGDDDIEVDRRRIRDRIAELKEKLAAAEKEADTRRQRRAQARRVALVGYTNAGKSSLMRALTGSEVLVADKLFATLGTTVRIVERTQPKILISDTVGFIKNLPHALVASFKSTLDEAHEASLLLFVVDASDPDFEGQLAVTKKVLGEIDATTIPSLLILNKIDRVDEVGRRRLALRHPHAIQLSALNPDDVERLRAQLVAHFDTELVEETLAVPYARTGALLGQVHEHCRVLKEQWDDWGVRLHVKAPPDVWARLTATLGPVDPPPFVEQGVDSPDGTAGAEP